MIKKQDIKPGLMVMGNFPKLYIKLFSGFVAALRPINLKHKLLLGAVLACF
jgi:hypothetical protein